MRAGTGGAGEPGAVATRGLILDYGWRYDAMVWVLDRLTRGRLAGLRARVLEAAALRPGEAVLDVGCGTGALAVEAKRQVGEAGEVCGVDPGPRQVSRARRRAARAGMDVEFRAGVIEDLPYPAHRFDVVFSTLMMHHLPDDLKSRGLAEIHRVLPPDGRLVIADLKRYRNGDGRMPMGVGALAVDDLPPVLEAAGFEDVRSHDVPLLRVPRRVNAAVLTARS
jgi:ubiquinone/menaquinone biosynthesis C-methylase UbiE